MAGPIQHVRVPSVRLVQGHVVADVQITAEDEEVSSANRPGGVLGGARDPRGAYSGELTSTARSLLLLQGSTAVYSLDHVLDPADPTSRLCTCDPNTNGRPRWWADHDLDRGVPRGGGRGIRGAAGR